MYMYSLLSSHYVKQCIVIVPTPPVGPRSRTQIPLKNGMYLLTLPDLFQGSTVISP